MPAPTAKLESRVAVLETIARTFSETSREYRQESKEDIKAILASLDGLKQTVASMGSAVHTLTLQDCGARLNALESRLTVLEGKTANITAIERDVEFYRRVMGVGWNCAWRLLALIVGSGGLGALLTRLWSS